MPESKPLYKHDSVVLIPTYNEKENIENIIRAVFGLPEEFDILVIDDNSPDGTAHIVKELQKEFTDRLRHTSPVSNGLSHTGTITSSRWMPTSRTTPTTCSG